MVRHWSRLCARGATWAGRLGAAIAIVVLGAGASLGQSPAPRATPPAPNCTSGVRATPAQSEGPFYKANTPQRTSLVQQSMAGTRVILTGYVLSTECRPIARAWLDFWQADDKGEYDNAGFRLRGHQFTDAGGIYYLETILPGLYPGRPRHIHVKVRAPNGPILTTQIYFPGEQRTQSDGIFNPALVAPVRDAAGGKVAAFNFILDMR